MPKSLEKYTFSDFDIAMMRLALAEAKLASEQGDVPVGAVITCHEQILAQAHNQRQARQDPTAHAEILAIQEAARNLKTWHLDNCRLYVTLEPCPMCAGAIINSRITEVIFGARQEKSGALVSVCQLFESNWNHQAQIKEGLLAEESAHLLKQFFRQRRREKSQLGGPGQRRKAAYQAWLTRLEEDQQ